nr:amidohydrolase family protein [Ignavibacteria bacterium]
MNIKNVTIRTLLLFTLIVFFSCGEKPDIVYTNGKIYTMDENNTVVEALAIKNGKILETGSSKEIGEKYNSEEVFDLKGATVLPGFIDSEGSIIEYSKNLNFINLSYAKSIKEIEDMVLEKTKNTYEGEWIGGYGWSELNIPESELLKIDKKILDKIAPNYLVYLVNANLNTVWVNSRVLNTLKIDKNTVPPPDGEIERYEDGEPTGMLFDAAVNLVKDSIPGLLKFEMSKQIEKGAKEIVKYGITEVHDRTLGKEGLEIFRQLIDSNKFPLKVYAIISGEDSSYFESFLNKGIESNYKDKLTIRAVSLDYDGAFELQDAAMTEDYLADPKRKIPYVSDAEIENVYSKAADKNFQFFLKAVGDKAVNNSLNIIEKEYKKKNPKDPRTVLEYCEFVTPKDLNKISELKIIPSVRPDICMNDLQIVSQIIESDN